MSTFKISAILIAFRHCFAFAPLCFLFFAPLRESSTWQVYKLPRCQILKADTWPQQFS